MPSWSAPDRSATGEFGPGDDTGAVLVNTISGLSFAFLHWASLLPMALLIVAKIGSLAAGATTTVAWAGSAASDKAIRFRATRSADGTEVTLGFDLKFEFLSGYAMGSASPQPWRGPDHAYAWAAHSFAFFDSRVSQALVSSKLACEAAATGFNDYSGAGHLFHSDLVGEPFLVPSSAPSDLRVLHIALWWDAGGVATPPTADELDAYMGRWTCRQWSVGRVAWGRPPEWF